MDTIFISVLKLSYTNLGFDGLFGYGLFGIVEISVAFGSFVSITFNWMGNLKFWRKNLVQKYIFRKMYFFIYKYHILGEKRILSFICFKILSFIFGSWVYSVVILNVLETINHMYFRGHMHVQNIEDISSFDCSFDWQHIHR